MVGQLRVRFPHLPPFNYEEIMDKESKDLKWFEKPFIGRYSVIDFARTGIAIIFIMLCMSFLTLYVHKAVNETAIKKREIRVEYINFQQDDEYIGDSDLIREAPDLVIDEIIKFPISYNKFDIHGYMLLDPDTGARYLYVRNGDGSAMAVTRYWTEEEIKGIIKKTVKKTIQKQLELGYHPDVELGFGRGAVISEPEPEKKELHEGDVYGSNHPVEEAADTTDFDKLGIPTKEELKTE